MNKSASRQSNKASPGRSANEAQHRTSERTSTTTTDKGAKITIILGTSQETRKSHERVPADRTKHVKDIIREMGASAKTGELASITSLHSIACFAIAKLQSSDLVALQAYAPRQQIWPVMIPSGISASKCGATSILDLYRFGISQEMSAPGRYVKIPTLLKAVALNLFNAVYLLRSRCYEFDTALYTPATPKEDISIEMSHHLWPSTLSTKDDPISFVPDTGAFNEAEIRCNTSALNSWIESLPAPGWCNAVAFVEAMLLLARSHQTTLIFGIVPILVNARQLPELSPASFNAWFRVCKSLLEEMTNNRFNEPSYGLRRYGMSRDRYKAGSRTATSEAAVREGILLRLNEAMFRLVLPGHRRSCSVSTKENTTAEPDPRPPS